MVCDFEFIVIGSGAGGAAFAHACAAAQRRVLLLERGSRPEPLNSPLDEKATLVEKQPYDKRSIAVNGDQRRLFMGGVLGGGTAIFGALMLRPSKDDFQPGRHYGERLPRELWQWPIQYEQLAPFYDEAEALFSLSGNREEDLRPLEPPGPSLERDVLPIAPINERLMQKNRARGTRPFRLPLAIKARLCQRCSACAGFLCPHGARRSAGDLVEEAIKRHGLTVRTGIEVERLETSHNGRITGIVVRDLQTERTEILRAATYALAAGAIGSAAIALKSELGGPQVGRNYMLHYSPLAAGIFLRKTRADETFIKQVGFADFYFGTPHCPHKMGIVQSLPVPGPLMLSKAGLRKWPHWSKNLLRKHMLPLCGIVEDLPNPENRVTVNTNGISLTHRYSEFDIVRGRALGQEMRKILRRAGAFAVLQRTIPPQEHVAHQCGTLRMGQKPEQAVVDADCRMFGKSNLFVVDGSVLPTSLGVGPSLTIVANALRVARIALAGI